MNAKTKTIYYCDFCRKHGLLRGPMEKHEAGCTMNPQRVCRWAFDGHSNGSRVIDIAPLAEWMRSCAPLKRADIDALHDEVQGCPACMLAVLRQSGVEYHYDYTEGGSATLFVYQDEVERFRKDEREDADREEMYAIERTWL